MLRTPHLQVRVQSCSISPVGFWQNLYQFGLMNISSTSALFLGTGNTLKFCANMVDVYMRGSPLWMRHSYVNVLLHQNESVSHKNYYLLS